MIDPLSLVTTYGLKVIGGYAAGYVGWKLWPKKENFPELMRLTFIRSGLFVKIDNGKDKREETARLLSFDDTFEWGFVFKYRLIPGLSIQKFIEKKDIFDTAFNGECNIFGQGNELTIEIMRAPMPEKEYFDIEKIKDKAEGMAIPFPLGVTRKGIEVIDLASAPHSVVGGESGSGKSVFVCGCLTALALLKTPQELNMTLVDLKHGVELSIFSDLPHVTGFAKRRSEVKNVFEKVKRIVEERGELFAQVGVKKIEVYNKRFEPLPYHLILVDEMAELDEEHLEYIDYFARIARYTGVHMLLATQRPDKDVMPGGIKANIPLTIAFKTKNEVNSRILLDNGNAAKLPPIKGRCIVQFYGERQAQALLLEENHAEAILRSLRKVVAADEPQGTGHRHSHHYI